MKKRQSDSPNPARRRRRRIGDETLEEYQEYLRTGKTAERLEKYRYQVPSYWPHRR